MRNWPPRACLALSLLAALAACGPLPPLKAYDGEDQPDTRLAILDWSSTSDIYVLAVDGKDTVVIGDDFGGGEQEQAKMLPGRHDVRYGRCGVRELRQSIFGSYFIRHCHSITGTFDAQAGHRYLVRSAATAGSVEISDAATLQVMTSGPSAAL